MFNNKTVSIVISTYKEKNSIKTFIDKCYETGLVDEVIVVNARPHSFSTTTTVSHDHNHRIP